MNSYTRIMIIEAINRRLVTGKRWHNLRNSSVHSLGMDVLILPDLVCSAVQCGCMAGHSACTRRTTHKMTGVMIVTSSMYVYV